MGSSHLPRPVIVRWPAQAELRRACAALATPCLLVVDEGPLPELGPNEDAVRLRDGERDAAVRLGRLTARTAAFGRSPSQLCPRAPEPARTPSPAAVRAVRRVVDLLVARPERLLTWLDLAPVSATRSEIADEAARLLDTAGWWVEVLDGVGILAGPAGERIA